MHARISLNLGKRQKPYKVPSICPLLKPLSGGGCVGSSGSARHFVAALHGYHFRATGCHIDIDPVLRLLLRLPFQVSGA